MSFRRMLVLKLLMLLSLCTACQRSTYLVLSIDRGAATPATVASLDLELTLNGRALPPQTVASPRPIMLPSSVTLQLGLEQGDVQVAVRAIDEQGAEVDRGSGAVALHRGETSALTVRLDQGRALPLLRADREELDLGTVVLGGSAMAPTGTFEVRNDGRVASGVLVTALTGQESFALLGDLCQGKSLSVGERCTVTVAFQPGSAGAVIGALQIKPAAGAALSLKLSGVAVTPGALVVTPDARNFMGVILGASAEGAFVVRNSGGSATGKLVLSLGGAGAADFEISQRTCEGTRLDPQGECPLAVRFRPTSAGSKAATLSIKAEPGGTAVLALSGAGLRPAALALSAAQLDLGAVVVNNSSADGVIVVSNSGDLPTGALDAVISGADFKFKVNGCMGKDLASGASCELRVILEPKSLGAKLGEVRISGPAPLVAVSVRLAGSGIAPAQISLSPSVLDFGTVAVGSSADLTVTVTNNGGAATGTIAGVINTMAPMGVLRVDMMGCGSLAMGASCAATVSFRPGSYGQQRGDLVISATQGGTTTASVSGVGRDTVPLTVSVQGQGSGSVQLPAAGAVSGMAVTCTAASCTQSYYRTLAAPQVTISATPSASSSFVGWSGGCSGTALSCTVTLSASQQVVANFALQQYQLSVAKTGVGTGAVNSSDGRIACGATCSYDRYDHGTLVTLTATPAAGYYFGGWSGGVNCGMEPVCQVSMTAARNVTASFTYANYIFVTSKSYTLATLQNLGGGADPAARTLAGADKVCNTAAMAAGLRGTYVAWLSSQAQNASARIPASARGWIRTDGKPFADSLSDLLTKGQVLYPPELDEVRNSASQDLIVTGTFGNGTAMPDGARCQNWSQTTGVGDLYGGVRYGGSWSWTDASFRWLWCSFDYVFYCMGTDFSALTRPPARPAQARVAFVSRSRFNPSTGLRGADLICADEARQAALPNGTYLALLASNTASAVSRFTLNGAPIYRTDNVMVVEQASDLGTKARLTAPIEIDAFGLNRGPDLVWTGATAPNAVGSVTCQNWTSVNAADKGKVGFQHWAGPEFFNRTDVGCDGRFPVYCMSL